MIMVVRVSHCRWYVSCESPHGMFLVCYYSGANHMGGPLSRTGAYIYVYIYIHCSSFLAPVMEMLRKRILAAFQTVWLLRTVLH